MFSFAAIYRLLYQTIEFKCTEQTRGKYQRETREERGKKGPGFIRKRKQKWTKREYEGKRVPAKVTMMTIRKASASNELDMGQMADED